MRIEEFTVDAPALTARISGHAALPIMLLFVGANLRLRGLSGSVSVIGLSIVGKHLVNPLAVLLAALVLV